MEKKLSFIGCGNMARAMINGIIESQFCSAEKITVTDIMSDEAKKYAIEKKINFASSSADAVRAGDIIFLCVKPNQLNDVCETISQSVENKIVVSIAAGMKISLISTWLPENTKLMRAMPNLPITVGHGMSVICGNDEVNEDDLEYVLSCVSSFGRAAILSEDKIDAFTTIASSSPAMLFIMLEAMADGGVLLGLSREESYVMAAQAMTGAAQMVLMSKKHPAELKDAVCSPGGTTIEMVAMLEECGFRSAVIESMAVCYEKCKELSE